MGALDGKVAIVTGAGRGVGRAHALELASEGASVVVNDVGGADDVVEEIAASGGNAVANTSSVSDWAATEAMVRQAVDTFGDLHVLVNNAGILRDAMSFNLGEADWDVVLDVHLKGHFCLSRHAGAYWRDQAKAGATVGRRIINTSSEAGLYGSAGQANYASAKAGIIGLTWVFAREYERYGVTANAIAPRARTQMTENIPLFAAKEEGEFDPFEPVHVARVVAWLATDASADVSGQIFIVMGGGVHLIAPFELAASLTKKGAGFSLAELEAGKAELFTGRSPGVPKMHGPAWS
jgi:NAD(P)-dependent dehydrogenase (short-subunit alcohol dehydrogenase family)